MKLLIIILAIMLASCSTSVKQPAQHDFGAISTVGKTGKPDISVTTPQWLWNECIHYRLMYSSPSQLSCYSLDQWIAPPPDLFKQLLTRNISTQHRLLVELGEFEQQFDSPNVARVVMTMRVSAYATQSETLLATQDFHLQQVSATANAAGAIAGFSKLTQQASEKIQHWLNSLAN